MSGRPAPVRSAQRTRRRWSGCLHLKCVGVAHRRPSLRVQLAPCSLERRVHRRTRPRRYSWGRQHHGAKTGRRRMSWRCSRVSARNRSTAGLSTGRYRLPFCEDETREVGDDQLVADLEGRCRPGAQTTSRRRAGSGDGSARCSGPMLIPSILNAPFGEVSTSAAGDSTPSHCGEQHDPAPSPKRRESTRRRSGDAENPRQGEFAGAGVGRHVGAASGLPSAQTAPRTSRRSPSMHLGVRHHR